MSLIDYRWINVLTLLYAWIISGAASLFSGLCVVVILFYKKKLSRFFLLTCVLSLILFAGLGYYLFFVLNLLWGKYYD